MRVRTNWTRWTVLIAFAAFCAFLGAGCSEDREIPTGPDRPLEDGPIGGVALAVGPAWEGNILSELKYTLSRQRTGYSNLSYNGCAMADWDWPHSDVSALARCSSLSSPYNGPLGLWRGAYRQGGPCKFFVNMVLYRSSYGYPGGHLYLKTGYSWSPWHPCSEAGPGWILQSSSLPHTAVVIKVLPEGLDVIDANWIGGNGSYAIGRHVINWSQLASGGFRAYRAHEICRLVS